MTKPERSQGYHERRRGIRIVSTFLVEIKGFDDGLQWRRGNLSVSGTCFEIDRPVGAAGSVFPLRIAAFENSPVVEVMGRLVRVIHHDDIWTEESIAGVAFEFLIDSEQVRESLRQMVKTTAERQLQKAKELKVDYLLNALLEGVDQPFQEATVRSLTQSGMVMETNWPVLAGETIRVAVEVPKARKTIQMDGRAIQSRESEVEGRKLFTTEVQFVVSCGDSWNNLLVERSHGGTASLELKATPPPDGSPDKRQSSLETFGFSIPDAMDQLISEMIDSRPKIQPPPPTQSLRGSMSLVSLPSLLSFLQLERRSGELQVTYEKRKAVLYVCEGQVVDLEPAEDSATVREALFEILSWPAGEFEFVFRTVKRKNRVGMPTNALLLELARKQDEIEKTGR